MRKLILAAAASGVLLSPVPARAQQPTFSVYPVPGTLTAATGTDVSFRGGNAAALGEVKVTGSESGTHTGTLKDHSDGQGASFVPAKAFEAGEKVTVTTGRAVVGASNGDYSFSIGESTGRKNRMPEAPDVGRGDVQDYATRPDLMPPAVTVSTAKPGRAPGYVFLAPKGGRGQDGPMIINDKGQLVWFKPTPGHIPADFRVQTYQGKPVLTWWEGRLYGGDGDGVGEIYDTNYKQIATVHAGKGYSLDIHEFTITPRDTAVVLAYERYKRDLSPWGGRADGRIVDNIVQEIDLKTGLVIFEWHGFGNVSPNESNVPPPTDPGFEWEYLHVNAAEVAPDGNFLISARNTSTLYKIDRATGKIIWRLGGKKSDFKLGPGVRFDWQHSPRTQPDGTIRLYDNSAAPPKRKASRVLRIKLDEQAKTATLITAWHHPKNLLSASQGNVETLPNGDVFVGWGSQRYFTEFNANGEVVFDGHLALGNDNYRAFRFPWAGTPQTAPKVVATASGGTIAARMSWNGATNVANWQLLAGSSPTTLAPVGQSPWKDFETAITIRGSQPYVAVRALDLTGKELAVSAAVKPTSG